MIDGLVELLIQVTHRITVKAERRALEELVEEAVEVRGKAGILLRVAEAAIGSPEGVVREVIFPAAGQSTLEALARKAQALGTPRGRRVHTAVRASYGSYYRRMMPKLLAALEFRSNNGAHRPLLDALDAIRRAEGEGRQYFRADEVAIEGVIRPKWRDIVLEDAPGGGRRINRINYEICVLQTLREQLRCKEIWVVGANRFRNPDEDLPADFADRRAACYDRLGLPMQASDFVAGLRVELADALRALDHGMPRNPGVRLDPRRRHPIIVSPLDPQPEPPGLFVSERDQALTRQGVNYLVAAAAGRAGLACVHPHTLRHSCGFALADKGHDLRLIQDYLGHRDPRRTVHYTRTAGRRFEGLWR